MSVLRNRVFVFFAGFAACLLFTSLFRSSSSAPAAVGGARHRILLFGDSLTAHGFEVDSEGWVASLCSKWQRKADVLNRGFSGYNTAWALSLLDTVVLNEPALSLIAIFFGANDAIDELVLQHVPLDKYEANLREMVRRLQIARPKTRLLLISPPPVFEPVLIERNKAKNKAVTADRENERTQQYAQRVVQIGKDLKVPVVDAFTHLGGLTLKRQDYLSDGLHLSSLGNTRVFELVYGKLKEAYPDLLEQLETKEG